MSYKIIALDIDGTLTNSDKIITPKTYEALIGFQETGGKIILASGRPTVGIYPQAERLKLKSFGGYILSFNGGCAVNCKTDKILFQSKLDLSCVSEITDVIKDCPVGINTYEGNNIIVGNQVNKYTELEAKINSMNIKYVEHFGEYIDFDINKCLIHGEPEEILKLERIFSEKYKGNPGVFKSEEFFLEIVPKGVDKASSIDRLLKLIGIKREECIACGDGFNDISMLEYAGLGVAMSNAKDTVKSAADFITRSNDEDGIAYVLERYCGIGDKRRFRFVG